jgi:protein-disulfide isomerase
MKGWCLVLVALLLVAGRASAQTKTCDALRGSQRATAQSILASYHPYRCCDETLGKCLRKQPVCPLLPRLADDVCRRAQNGHSRTEIERELERRGSSATGPKHFIDLDDVPRIGDAAAPVTLVVYACARCPLCARVVPALHASVTSGRLRGKVKFYAKPFPIRTHQHATVAAMAWMAAQELGRPWEILLALYSNFDRFDPDGLPDVAQSQGLERERFRALLDDPAVRDKLVASKKEGVRNKVDSTPAIFIDGRRYLASLELPSLEDFVEERIEQAAGH